MSAYAPLQSVIDQLRASVPAHAQWRLDSRAVQPGDVFIAVPGLHVDGRDFITAALKSGASGVLQHVDAIDVDQEKSPTKESLDSYQVNEPDNQDTLRRSICFKRIEKIWFIENLASQLGELAHAWYGRPSEQLTVIALTGTNGKTSCTQWLTQALKHLGHQVGAIGTLGVTSLNGEQQSGTLTTPDVVSLHNQLAIFVAQGAEYVVMEASSIGLDQGRLNGVNIQLAGFINLTHDHLDYHGDMQQYANAKAKLFKRQTLRGAVINQDDPYHLVMMNACQTAVTLFGTHSACAVQAKNIIYNPAGTHFEMSINGHVTSLQLPFYGAHNVSNLLCVASMLSMLGFGYKQIVSALHALKPVAGRMESVLPLFASNVVQPLVVVDYAHTPDALKHVLITSQAIAQQRQSQLWCVFGCGGDRDTVKRSIMGDVASLNADHVIITSDNPRSESADSIIEQIMSGVVSRLNKPDSSVRIVTDRAMAILRCILDADPADVIVIAGKGHETGQEMNGVTYPFDDRHWAAAGLLLKQMPTFETDSRSFTPGAVFLAIKGDTFDGHVYLAKVRQAGAIAAIVNEVDHDVAMPQIALGDTRQALTKMASAWRQSFNIPVIGVTGSNGKTTTKEMIAAMLAAAWGDDARLATKGNLNNDLGVPLTVLRLRSTHRAAVIELGMNHPGEIVPITQCAQPTIGLVLNAQREHQEFMQSVQAVAQENGSVLMHLSGAGVAIFPAADEYSALWQTMSRAQQTLTFGQDVLASFKITNLKTIQSGGHAFTLKTPDGEVNINLPLPGIHNVLNAAAACACAWSAGVDLHAMAQALQNFGAVKGRMQVHVLTNTQTLIDDTYNANPDSVRAAIDVLVTMPTPRLFVLGDMGEVGQDSAALHAEVGHYAKQAGVDQLLVMGTETRQTVAAFGAHGMHCNTPEEVCAEILKRTPHSILVKGSRFMKMERVVNQFMQIKQQVIAPDDAHKNGVQHAV